MQLTLLCQRKLALPAQNFCTMKSSEPVKNLKTSHGPNLKGTVSRDEFNFLWHVRSKNRGRGHFLNFRVLQ
jgi:hypothetical protein